MEEIEVVIETLFLDGFGPADGQRFSTAFQDELARRIRESGLPSGWKTQISIPILQVEIGADPQSMGRQVAGALYDRTEQ